MVFDNSPASPESLPDFVDQKPPLQREQVAGSSLTSGKPQPALLPSPDRKFLSVSDENELAFILNLKPSRYGEVLITFKPTDN